MVKLRCNYNSKHKFDTMEKKLDHESQCPDKEKRKDLIVCPFTNRHVIKVSQLENHIINCDYKKHQKFKKEEKEEEKNNIEKDIFKNKKDNINDKNRKNKKQNDIKKYLDNIFNFDDLDSNKNVFDEEDFVFKQCYI